MVVRFLSQASASATPRLRESASERPDALNRETLPDFEPHFCPLRKSRRDPDGRFDCPTHRHRTVSGRTRHHAVPNERAAQLHRELILDGNPSD